MEVIIEKIIIYGGVIVLCGIIVFLYLRRHIRKSKETIKKVERVDRFSATVVKTNNFEFHINASSTRFACHLQSCCSLNDYHVIHRSG